METMTTNDMLMAFAEGDALMPALSLHMSNLMQMSIDHKIALKRAMEALERYVGVIWQDPAGATETLEGILQANAPDEVLFAISEMPERIGPLRKSLFGGTGKAREAARKVYRVYRFQLTNKPRMLQRLLDELPKAFEDSQRWRGRFEQALREMFGHDAVNAAMDAANARLKARRERSRVEIRAEDIAY